MGKDDHALIRAVLSGDKDAYGALVARHGESMFRVAYRITENESDAEEIAQEAFLRGYRSLAEFDARADFCTWIYRIAVNESLNLLRRNGREEALDDEVDLPGPKSDDPEQRAAAAQRSARIRSALMRMSTNDRMVLMLRHFSEFSYQEIGQILDLDEKKVKSRLYEARQQLRGMLKDFPPD